MAHGVTQFTAYRGAWCDNYGSQVSMFYGVYAPLCIMIHGRHSTRGQHDSYGNMVHGVIWGLQVYGVLWSTE